jgi:hypothetical protein
VYVLRFVVCKALCSCYFLLAALQWLGEGSSVPSHGVKLVGSGDHRCCNPWPLLNKRNPCTEVSVMLHSSHLYGIAQFLSGWRGGVYPGKVTSLGQRNCAGHYVRCK